MHPQLFDDLTAISDYNHVRFGDGGEYCPRCVLSLRCMTQGGMQFVMYRCLRKSGRPRLRMRTVGLKGCFRYYAFPCVRPPVNAGAENIAWSNILRRSIACNDCYPFVEFKVELAYQLKKYEVALSLPPGALATALTPK